MAHDLERINWEAPWLAIWRSFGEPAAVAVLGGQSVAQSLNVQAGSQCPVRFVGPDVAVGERGYEAFISRTGTCPTRDNPHDFFNGLAWLGFPRTKLRLNGLHIANLASPAEPRGAARDALTVFDENAALLSAPDALWEALQAKDWSAVFGPLAHMWRESQLHLFGHALLEKLMVPRKSITAHVLRVPSELREMAALDAWLDGHLAQQALSMSMFAHLPVLGVPTWWPANTQPGFYADVSVFRPSRRSSKYAKNVGTSPGLIGNEPAGL